MNFDLQLILFFVCLVGMFIYAGAETGFVSWNQMKVNHLAERGLWVGRWGLFLVNKKNRLLSAILIGSNLAVIGASLFFNSILSHFDQISILSKIPSPESWLLTPFVVLFCEMLPKSLFRIYSFQLTIKFIPILIFTYYLTLPFTWLIAMLTNRLQLTTGDQDQSFKTKNREEMVLITAEGARTGALFESANKLFNNVLQLKNHNVTEIMHEIKKIQTKKIFKVTDTVSAIKSGEIGSDEVIIFDANGTKPVGYISIIDLISAKLEDSISSYIRPLMVLEWDTNLIFGLKAIIKDQRNIFLVGGKDGLIIGILRKADLFGVVFKSRKIELKNAF